MAAPVPALAPLKTGDCAAAPDCAAPGTDTLPAWLAGVGLELERAAAAELPPSAAHADRADRHTNMGQIPQRCDAWKLGRAEAKAKPGAGKAASEAVIEISFIETTSGAETSRAWVPAAQTRTAPGALLHPWPASPVSIIFSARCRTFLQRGANCRHASSLTGYAPATALSFVALVDNIERFSASAKLCNYLGLVPHEYSSGEKQQRGHITKLRDSRWRCLLVECAWGYCEDSTRRTKRFETARCASRRDAVNAIAAVALARKLATILFAMTHHRRASSLNDLSALRAIAPFSMTLEHCGPNNLNQTHLTHLRARNMVEHVRKPSAAWGAWLRARSVS
jgi:hypothetical protein